MDNRIWTRWFWTGSIFSLLVGLAVVRGQSARPDTAALLDEAHTSPPRLIFAEDFEEPKPRALVEWYGGQVAHKVGDCAVTTEQAFSGKRAFKIQVAFEPGRYGTVYFRLPVQIPVWSDLTITLYVKSQAPAKTSFFHGTSWGNAEEGIDGNVLQGRKIADKNGWEEWRVVAKPGGMAGQFISGPALMFALPDHSPATTVTLYVDNITVTGKLPSNWSSKWARVYRYFTVDGDRHNRAAGARRLTTMKAWYAECRRQSDQLTPLAGAAPIVAEQYKTLAQTIRGNLAAVPVMLDNIAEGLVDAKTPFHAKLNPPERLLMLARHYLTIAAMYPAYAKTYGDTDIMTFALDITQSYPILPAGPQAHNEELSYYDWSEKVAGLENPQILPNAALVVAAPTRTLTGFGCRGTYVPLSFVIRSRDGLDGLTLTASGLTGDAGKIPASAVDLRVVGAWYRPFNNKPRLVSELLLHDPAFVVPVAAEGKNKYKDPRFGDDAATLQPVTIPAGTNRQFYALVKIPEGAAAGRYRGTITSRSRDGKSIVFQVDLDVLPFDLAPTPYAYSFFYRSYLRNEAFKKSQGIHSWYKTLAQFEADLKGMVEHGCNTLNLYDGAPVKVGKEWDFSELDQRLKVAKQAGLTRSPFTWLGHNVSFIPDNRTEDMRTWDQILAAIRERVAAANAFCRKQGYPRPAFYGADEASGEALMQLSQGYRAVNEAGGLVAVACYPNYFSEIGPALSLPIVYGGAQTLLGQKNIHDSQKAGDECWIYNCPSTNMPASPSVYRRRYGLALWRNGEQGAAPWEYCGMPQIDSESGYEAISNHYNLYAVAYPTWSGKPIDTIIYEAWREGIYDTRYLATLQKHLAEVKAGRSDDPLVAEVEQWLKHVSVHEDLQTVRRQMADYTVKLSERTQQ